MEERRTYTMTAEDLRAAQRICELFRSYSSENSKQIKQVGRDLYAAGGHPRMMAVCLYINKYAEPKRDALGSALDNEWNGIGLWGQGPGNVDVNIPPSLLDSPEHRAVANSATPSVDAARQSTAKTGGSELIERCMRYCEISTRAAYDNSVKRPKGSDFIEAIQALGRLGTDEALVALDRILETDGIYAETYVAALKEMSSFQNKLIEHCARYLDQTVRAARDTGIKRPQESDFIRCIRGLGGLAHGGYSLTDEALAILQRIIEADGIYADTLSAAQRALQQATAQRNAAAKAAADSAAPKRAEVPKTAPAAAAVAAAKPKDRPVVECRMTPVYTMTPESVMRHSHTASAETLRWAYVERLTNSQRVVTNDSRGPEFLQIAQDSPVFSSDGRRFAYVGLRGTKDQAPRRLVLDGVEGQPHEQIPSGYIVFSPDASRVAHIAQRDMKMCAVVDGAVGKAYGQVAEQGVLFSPNGKRVAYGARRGQWFTVVDGIEGEEYDNISDLVFSPDSQHLAFAAKRGQAWSVVLDNEKTGQRFDDAVPGNIGFYPDSRRLAYV